MRDSYVTPALFSPFRDPGTAPALRSHQRVIFKFAPEMLVANIGQDKRVRPASGPETVPSRNRKEPPPDRWQPPQALEGRKRGGTIWNARELAARQARIKGRLTQPDGPRPACD
jgi:hypothetical protein